MKKVWERTTTIENDQQAKIRYILLLKAILCMYIMSNKSFPLGRNCNGPDGHYNLKERKHNKRLVASDSKFI